MDDEQLVVEEEQVVLDAATRAVLERVRELFAEMLPVLAVTESLLGITDRDRYVGREWLPSEQLGE